MYCVFLKSNQIVFSFIVSIGSLCGCDLCEQLLLLVPWSRPLGGHPHPAKHSVWELVWKVPETHYPERIWSRHGAGASQCEHTLTYTINCNANNCSCFLKMYFPSSGSTCDVYGGVPEGCPAELPQCVRPEEEAVCCWWTHLELCRLHDFTRYDSCTSRQSKVLSHSSDSVHLIKKNAALNVWVNYR